ncbi:SH3 domain-containing protein [Acidaminococcus fermentans]
MDYFDEGEKVEITGRKNNWYQVKRANGQTGYVSTQFCRRL